MKRILFCLMVALSTYAVSAQNVGNMQTSETQQVTVTPADFNNVYLSWSGSYKDFGIGSYGIGFLTLGENGWGATMSVHGSWGIVDHGQLGFMFGPAYGYVLHPNVMVYGQLRGEIHTYDKVKENSSSTDQKVNGGVYFAPGLRLRSGKFSIGAAFNFGWENGNHNLAKNIELSIGYDL